MRQQDWLTQQRIGLEHLLKQIKSELANTTQQIEAFLNLQSILIGLFKLPPTHARWQAFEIITCVFNGVQIDFLLDDFIRKDEQQDVISWEKIALQKNWPFSTTRYRMEKDAYLM
jgi:hypothetical protein